MILHRRRCIELSGLRRRLAVGARLRLPVVVAGLMVGSPGTAHGAAPPVPEGWSVPPELIDAGEFPVDRAWDRALAGFIPMQDGVRLHYAVLLPPGAPAFESLLTALISLKTCPTDSRK